MTAPASDPEEAKKAALARRLTLCGLALAGAVLGYVELRALANKGSGDTISEIVADAGAAQPLALIAVGATASHFAGGSPALQRACGRFPLLALGIGIGAGLAWPLRGLR